MGAIFRKAFLPVLLGAGAVANPAARAASTNVNKVVADFSTPVDSLAINGTHALARRQQANGTEYVPMCNIKTEPKVITLSTKITDSHGKETEIKQPFTTTETKTEACRLIPQSDIQSKNVTETFLNGTQFTQTAEGGTAAFYPTRNGFNETVTRTGYSLPQKTGRGSSYKNRNSGWKAGAASLAAILGAKALSESSSSTGEKEVVKKTSKKVPLTTTPRLREKQRRRAVRRAKLQTIGRAPQSSSSGRFQTRSRRRQG
jgi:hypothetical protein